MLTPGCAHDLSFLPEQIDARAEARCIHIPADDWTALSPLCRGNGWLHKQAEAVRILPNLFRMHIHACVDNSMTTNDNSSLVTRLGD